jgi:hypothetical protein
MTSRRPADDACRSTLDGRRRRSARRQPRFARRLIAGAPPCAQPGHAESPRPDAFLDAIAPFRDGLVVGCECMFAWYWLAHLCEDQHLPFVLGDALYL